ncbi:MAG: hypothetical protein M1510_07830, partial [Nitrospirae bacterium]|nr:hypothetical protein [Nitrospirota bacterium]
YEKRGQRGFVEYGLECRFVLFLMTSYLTGNIPQFIKAMIMPGAKFFSNGNYPPLTRDTKRRCISLSG